MRGRAMILSRDQRAAKPLPAILLPALMATGFLFGGLDSGIGQSLLSLAGGLLLGCSLTRDRLSPQFWRAISPPVVLLGLAACWGWIASASYFAKGDLRTALAPDLAQHELVGFGGIVCLLLVSVMIGYRQSVTSTVEWWVRLGVIVLLAGVLLALANDPGTWAFWTSFRDERYLGTLNNANVAAATYGVTAILALGRALGTNSLKTKTQSWIVLLLCICASVMTASRSGMIFTALAAVALIALGTRTDRSRVAMPVVILSALIAMVLSTQLSYRLLARFDLLDSQFDFRVGMWSHFTDIASASPWVGYGLGSFPTLNLRYAGDPYQAQQIWTVNSPHNLVLSMVLSAGWPYALLILGACALILRRIFVHWHRCRPSIEEMALVVASFLLAACSMVDIGLQVPALCAAAAVMTGMAWGRAIRFTAGAQSGPAQDATRSF